MGWVKQVWACPGNRYWWRTRGRGVLPIVASDSTLSNPVVSQLYRAWWALSIKRYLHCAALGRILCSPTYPFDPLKPKSVPESNRIDERMVFADFIWFSHVGYAILLDSLCFDLPIGWWWVHDKVSCCAKFRRQACDPKDPRSHEVLGTTGTRLKRCSSAYQPLLSAEQQLHHWKSKRDPKILVNNGEKRGQSWTNVGEIYYRGRYL